MIFNRHTRFAESSIKPYETEDLLSIMTRAMHSLPSIKTKRGEVQQDWHEMKALVLLSKYQEVMDLPDANSGCYATKDNERLPEDQEDRVRNEVRKTIEFADAKYALHKRVKRTLVLHKKVRSAFGAQIASVKLDRLKN